MSVTTAAFMIAMIELAMKYGVPGVLEIIAKWEVQNPTLEDIEALKLRVPEPESYFKEITDD